MENKIRHSNKKMIGIVVIVIALVALGVIVGVIVANIIKKQEENQPSNYIDGQVETIMAQYQESLEKAESDEQKALLYIQRAYELREIMFTYGSNECEQIQEDIGVAKKITTDESLLKVAESILGVCAMRESQTTQTVTIKSSGE